MLSDFFYCGVVAGGAMLGVGLIARAIPNGGASDRDIRSLAVMLAAFAEGLGVLAVVIGMLGVFVTEADDVGGVSAALMAIVPAALLGVPGLLLCRPGEPSGVREVIVILTSFAAALGVLVIIVALMAVLLETGNGASSVEPMVMALGVVGAAMAVGVGYIGGRGVLRLAGHRTGERPDVASARPQTVVAAAILEGIGILTVVGTMMLMFTEL